MDVKSAATQLITYLGSDPERIAQFVEHPYSTTATATGTDERISKEDMSQIVTQVAAQTNDQSLGSTDRANIASALLGSNGGSVHALTSALFGGGSQASAAAAHTGNLGGMVDFSGILSSLMGGASDTTATASASGAAGPSMAEILAKSVAGGLAARGVAEVITHVMGTSGAGKKDDGDGDAAASGATAAQAPDFSLLAQLAKGLLGK